MKAFLAVHGTQGAASASVRETVDGLTEAVVRALMRSRPGGGTFHIEDVQDQVELGLMRGSHHEVARAYVLYRERRTQERAKQTPVVAKVATPELFVIEGGQRVPMDFAALRALVESACANLGDEVKAEPILAETRRNLYDGVPLDEVYKACILAARTLIEKEPAYTRATARLLLHTIRREIIGGEVRQEEMGQRYAEYFPGYIKQGVKRPNCWTTSCCSTTWPSWVLRWTPRATCSSTTWACRPCTTAISCTSTNSASRCRRPSSCAWPWAWR
jgi:ribonucleoside-diphosphate reductase alpha chain